MGVAACLLLAAALAAGPQAGAPGASAPAAPGASASAASAPTDSAAEPESAPASPEDRGERAEEPEGGVGVSPIELVPRVELRQSFQRLDAGASVYDTVAEIDIQFLRRVLLRYQLVHRTVATPAEQISGIGDIQLDAIAVVAADPTYLVVLLGGAMLDTASEPRLGLGKQQLLLGAGAAIKPRRWLLGFALLQERFSVAGGASDARPDINQLTADAGVIVFGKHYNWLSLHLVPSLDFERGSAARCLGLVEVGSLVIGRVGLFVRAGMQLAGRPELDYSLAGGIRYLFKLDQGKPTPDRPRPP